MSVLLGWAVAASCSLAPSSGLPTDARPSDGPVATSRAAPAVGSPSASPAPSAQAMASSSPVPTAAPSPTAVSAEVQVGQRLMVAMTGLTPDAGILARIRAGQVGGIILFGFNIVDASQVRALTAALQAAAAAGGQPTLLIATDQEGGAIKRVPWIPPTLSPPRIGATGDVGVAREQGRQTGSALLDLGINMDLAPVADLPFSTASFLYRQGRTFAFDPDLNAGLVAAFADGLAAAGVLAVLKHFPGLGYAQHDTDSTVVSLNLTRAGMAPGLLPYQRTTRLPVVMLSNAVYTASDPANAAGWSPAIIGGILRGDLAFSGVTMTDSLTGAAASRRTTEAVLAVRAAAAGSDLVLVNGSAASSVAVHDALLQAARAGTIPVASLRASYDRIVALKALLAVSR